MVTVEEARQIVELQKKQLEQARERITETKLAPRSRSELQKLTREGQRVRELQERKLSSAKQKELEKLKVPEEEIKKVEEAIKQSEIKQRDIDRKVEDYTKAQNIFIDYTSGNIDAVQKLENAEQRKIFQQLLTSKKGAEEKFYEEIKTAGGELVLDEEGRFKGELSIDTEKANIEKLRELGVEISQEELQPEIISPELSPVTVEDESTKSKLKNLFFEKPKITQLSKENLERAKRFFKEGVNIPPVPTSILTAIGIKKKLDEGRIQNLLIGKGAYELMTRNNLSREDIRGELSRFGKGAISQVGSAIYETGKFIKEKSRYATNISKEIRNQLVGRVAYEVMSKGKLTREDIRRGISTTGDILVGETGKQFVGVNIVPQIFPTQKPDVTFQEIKTFSREKGGLPGKVVGEFIPTTPAEVAFTAGLFAIGGGAAGRTASKVTQAFIFGAGAGTALSSDTPIETRIAGGIAAGGIAGGTIFSFLNKPILRTEKIKAPRGTFEVIGTIGKDINIVRDEGTFNKVFFGKQKLFQISESGQRTTVTTRLRSILGLKNIYEGVPYGEGSGYTKAFNLLIKRGYSPYQAKAALRYFQPRFVEGTLKFGKLNVVKTGSSGEFTFLTEKPVTIIDEKLGIKTRGGRTIEDVYDITRGLIKNKGGEYVVEESYLTSGFLKRGTSPFSLRNLEITRSVLFGRGSKIKRGYEQIKSNFGKTFREVDYRNIEGISLEKNIFPRDSFLRINQESTILLQKTLDLTTKQSGFRSIGGKKTPLIQTFAENALKQFPKIEFPTIKRTPITSISQPTTQSSTPSLLGIPRNVGGAGLTDIQISKGQGTGGFDIQSEVTTERMTGVIKPLISDKNTFDVVESYIPLGVQEQKPIISVGPLVEQTPKTTQFPKTSQLPKLSETPIEVQLPRVIQLPKTSLIQKPVTSLASKTTPSFQRPPRPFRPLLIPRPSGKEGSTEKAISDLKKKGEGVDVVVGMQIGKTRTILKNADPARALKYAQKYVDRNIEASFRLNPTGKKAVGPKSKLSKVSKKFRPSKTNSLYLVEKKKYRLDSPLERRQIKLGRKPRTKKTKRTRRIKLL